jgi:cold shock CspA family protein
MEVKMFLFTFLPYRERHFKTLFEGQKVEFAIMAGNKGPAQPT